MKSTKKLALATIVTGALAFSHAAFAADDANMEKCYGIAKAGENACAHAKGLHSCAGQSKTDYDGGSWKMVKKGECKGMHGSLETFEGANKDIKG